MTKFIIKLTRKRVVIGIDDLSLYLRKDRRTPRVPIVWIKGAGLWLEGYWRMTSSTHLWCEVVKECRHTKIKLPFSILVLLHNAIVVMLGKFLKQWMRVRNTRTAGTLAFGLKKTCLYNKFFIFFFFKSLTRLDLKTTCEKLKSQLQ